MISYQPRDIELQKRIRRNAIDLRKNRTEAEFRLRQFLKRSGEWNVRFSVVVGTMIIDLALPHRNLLIEVDGSYHNFRRQKDFRRDKWLNNLGLNVLRVTNGEVFSYPSEIFRKIKSYQASKENRIEFNRTLRRARRIAYCGETNG